MGSKALSLSREDWIKIAKGAAIAVAGALITVGLEQVVPALEGSGAWGASIAAIMAIVLNTLRKWLTDTR